MSSFNRKFSEGIQSFSFGGLLISLLRDDACTLNFSVGSPRRIETYRMFFDDSPLISQVTAFVLYEFPVEGLPGVQQIDVAGYLQRFGLIEVTSSHAAARALSKIFHTQAITYYAQPRAEPGRIGTSVKFKGGEVLFLFTPLDPNSGPEVLDSELDQLISIRQVQS